MIYSEDIARVRNESALEVAERKISILKRKLREVESENRKLRDGIRRLIDKCSQPPKP